VLCALALNGGSDERVSGISAGVEVSQRSDAGYVESLVRTLQRQEKRATPTPDSIQGEGLADALILATPTPPPAVGELQRVPSVQPDIEERLALAALVSATFSDWPLASSHVVWAEAIGDWAGSLWRCHVYGGTHCLRGGWSPTRDCGLMQTNEVHRDKYEAHGWDMDVDCFVPKRNLVIAREIYDAQGSGAWTTAR